MKSAAERQRDRRRRQRDGAMVITIEVKPQSRSVFSEARWLREWDEDDPVAVAAAVQRLVDEMRLDGADE